MDEPDSTFIQRFQQIIDSEERRDIYRVLVERHYTKILHFTTRALGNETIAQDVTQEVFLRGYRSLNSFRGDSTFSTWITAIALNMVRTTRTVESRRRYVAEDTTSDDASERSATHSLPSIETTHIAHEAIAHFRACLAGLEERFARVVLLCGVQELSYEEASSALNIPIGTIRSRLNRARLALRDCMEKKQGALQ